MISNLLWVVFLICCKLSPTFLWSWAKTTSDALCPGHKRSLSVSRFTGTFCLSVSQAFDFTMLGCQFWVVNVNVNNVAFCPYFPIWFEFPLFALLPGKKDLPRQSCKMSNLLHGPKSSNQIYPPRKARKSRHLSHFKPTKQNLRGIYGSLSFNFFAQISPKMACFC